MIDDRSFRFDGETLASVMPGSARFDSDADALPFPVGGVFGPIEVEADTPTEEPAPQGWDAMDTLHAIEHVIDRMQGQLDELESDVNDVIAHIGGDDDGGWHPSAA
ncbi:MAG: hypothetical protein AAGH64_06255 [Planctomycetota bacterium]